MIREKEMLKLHSFNPKDKPEYIKIKKKMKSQNGFKLITFTEENYYCKANSNALQFTFEAGIAMLLEGKTKIFNQLWSYS